MELQLDIFQVAVVLIGGIVWLVRLEGKIKHAEHRVNEVQKDVDDLRIRHETLDSKIVDKLAEISERLARIEGAFHHKGEE